MVRKTNIKNSLAALSVLLGFGVIIYVFLPIASYLSLARIKYPNLISPIAENEFYENNAEDVDLTKASNWFSERGFFDLSTSKIRYYNLTIEDLKINNALVVIGGEDLSKNLIHYPGSSYPGKNGNSVIFGHSVLPSFFDPNDYLTIFSTLPTIDKGAEIIVNFDGMQYKYVVEAIFEVTPRDVEIFEQNISNSYLTLVTCTPPGDPRKPKRLIVRARLVPFS